MFKQTTDLQFLVLHLCSLLLPVYHLSLSLSGPEESRGVESTGRWCAVRGETQTFNSSCLRLMMTARYVLIINKMNVIIDPV